MKSFIPRLSARNICYARNRRPRMARLNFIRPPRKNISSMLRPLMSSRISTGGSAKSGAASLEDGGRCRTGIHDWSMTETAKPKR